VALCGARREMMGAAPHNSGRYPRGLGEDHHAKSQNVGKRTAYEVGRHVLNSKEYDACKLSI
jgi:hypothetical protein